MASILKSLRLAADPNRLRLMLLLEHEELSVAELQEILGKGQSQISTHLAQLKQAGLVGTTIGVLFSAAEIASGFGALFAGRAPRQRAAHDAEWHRDLDPADRVDAATRRHPGIAAAVSGDARMA